MADAHKALGGDAHKAEKLTRFYEARVASSPVRPLSDKTNQGAPAGILKKPSAVAVEPPAVPPSTPVTAALSLLSPAVSTPGGAAGAGTEGMASLTNISSLLVTLRAEREWLRSRIKRGEHERRATTAQLAQTEEQYKALAAKAETLRGRLGRQARVQAQAREQLGALDQKLRSISHTSVQFEEAVRESRGEAAWGARAADGGVAVVASDDATLPDTPRRGSGAAAVTQPVCLRTLQAGAAALCVSIDSPQGLVGAAAADGTVRLWHLFSGRSAHTLAAHRGCARSLHVHGSLVLSGGGGGEVHVGARRHGGDARRPHPRRLGSAGRIALRRLGLGRPHASAVGPRHGQIDPLARHAVRSVGRPGHAGGRRRHAAADQLEHGRPRRRVGRRRRPRRGGDVPAVLELGARVGVVRLDGQDVGPADGRVPPHAERPRAPPRHSLRAQFSRRAILSARNSLTPRPKFPLQASAVRTVRFSDHQLLTGSTDGTVRVWDLRTGGCARTLHAGAVVNSLRFDDQRVFVATNIPAAAGRSAADAGLLVYCSRTGERLGALGGADASVRSVDLAANLLASASADGTVRLWSAERMGEGEGGGPPPAAAEGAEAGA